MLCQKNLHLASQIRSSSLFYPRRRDHVYVTGAVCAKLVLSAVVCVDRKNEVIKEGLVCRLNYEEKRLYIHEIGGGG
jgi:hypothetical protein